MSLKSQLKGAKSKIALELIEAIEKVRRGDLDTAEIDVAGVKMAVAREAGGIYIKVEVTSESMAVLYLAAATGK